MQCIYATELVPLGFSLGSRGCHYVLTRLASVKLLLFGRRMSSFNTPAWTSAPTYQLYVGGSGRTVPWAYPQ